MKRKRTTEAAERQRHLSTDYGDVLKNASPLELELNFPAPTEAISLRLPRALLNRLRMIADARDVPYQSLIKMFLADCVRRVPA